VEQLVHALNQIEEEELWAQSGDNPPYYVIDEDASRISHYELIQANILLRSERIINNEMEERKNELVLNPKIHFFNVFHATQPPLSEKECLSRNTETIC